MEPTSLRFARIARRLTQAARAEGLGAPTFRSPPRVAGVTRTIRWDPGPGPGPGPGRDRDRDLVRDLGRGDGRPPVATVSVVLRGRPWAAVTADMIDGVIVANGLRGVTADRARAALWAALAGMDHLAA